MFFDDIVFPTDISFNSPGGPAFLTRIAKVPSGYHVADIKRDTPLCLWDVGYGAREINKIYDLYKLFNAVRGQGHMFLFKYWLDYTSIDGEQNTDDITPADQLIATASAGQTAFQLIKTYTVATASMVKTIYKPKAGTLQVSVDGSEEVSGWTMDETTGIITRSPGLSAGQVVRAGYEYYHPVRFSSDEFDPSFIAWRAGTVQVNVEEVRLSVNPPSAGFQSTSYPGIFQSVTPDGIRNGTSEGGNVTFTLPSDPNLQSIWGMCFGALIARVDSSPGNLEFTCSGVGNRTITMGMAPAASGYPFVIMYVTA